MVSAVHLSPIISFDTDKWPVEYIIYTATLPSALTGVDIAIFASAFAYISDVSSVKNRTLRVTILDVCYMITFPTGIALGIEFSVYFLSILFKLFDFLFFRLIFV